jgi:hypothetical protein
MQDHEILSPVALQHINAFSKPVLFELASSEAMGQAEKQDFRFVN